MVCVIPNKAHPLLPHVRSFALVLDHEDSKDTDRGFTGGNKPRGPGRCFGDTR